MWEQSPEPFLQDAALLPLAVLCASQNSAQLLSRVAQQVANIEASEQREEISACTQVLAGLRFDRELIVNFFREEIMEESVIYQDIIQKGRKQEAIALIMRQL